MNTADPRLIGPLPRSTPAGPERTSGRRHELPSDLLREASHRLRITSLLLAVLWLVATVLDHFALRAMSHGDPRWLRPQAEDVIAAASMLVSLALFVYTRKDPRDPGSSSISDWSTWCCTAFALGIMIHWHPVPSAYLVSPVICWIGPSC